MVYEAIQYVPIDSIDCQPQVRTTFAEQLLVGLARSIQEVGLQQPLRVRAVDDRFVVVDGERRLQAARMIKLAEVPVIVEEKPLCIGEVIHRQLVANLQRAGLTPGERARAIKRLMNETGWPATEAAGKCGISSATVTRLLAILELPEPVQARIDAGEIPESAGYLLKQVEDPEKRAALVAQMASGQLTRDALATEVKTERPTKSAKPNPGLNRATALLAGGDSVTVVGTELTLDRMVEALSAVLARIRKLRSRGIADVAMACRLLREEAKAETKAVPLVAEEVS
ncbi:MAG TPA: ParB/RepB/Spo0J family partition protein [Pirellulales bacterium]|jgi:ParB family chromosome partitioning protein